MISAAFSPDGSRIVTASGDKTARIWDAATGKEIAVLRGHERPRVFRRLQPRRVAHRHGVRGQDRPHLGRRDGKEIAVLRGHDGRVQFRRLQPRRVAHRHGVVGQDRPHLGRRDAARRSRSCAAMTDDVLSAAFSPDGSRIVTASEDKTARIWDAATGKEIAVLRGHDDGVNSAAFSPDGSRIVTASADKHRPHLGRGDRRRRSLVLRGHEDAVSVRRLQPRRVAHRHGVGDKTARIWDVRFLAMSAGISWSRPAPAGSAAYQSLRREEMRLAGYPDNAPEIDVCAD